jgi:hypothetical protein
MINISTIRTVASLVPSIIEAVKYAEGFIRGSGRGEEKKHAAVGNVIDNLKEATEEARRLQVPDAKTIHWFELVLHANELSDKIGDVVDSVVSLMNFLSKFNDVPDDPKVVN